MISLYDTLTRSLKELKPVQGNEVKLYTCGPTVYNYLHIGNWAAYVRWDTLVRVLESDGYDVNWVMNITDVGHLVSDDDEGEDKLQKGARREGKTAWEVAEFYTNDFIKGMDALGMHELTSLVKATDYIPQQLDMIAKLEAKGYTYVIDDGVYFDTSKLKDYGKLAGLKIEALKAGARVEFNKQKKNATDFALWKFSPANEQRDMEWESKWGKGFPGWHLECSAIAMGTLGETLDIHAGGIDHIPVHHTNEIAQSESVTGKPLANIWLHSSFINIEDKRIGKSVGNAITLQDILEQGFSPLDLRMLYLQSHYQNHANFTWGGLQAAHNRLINLQAFADLRFQLVDGGSIDSNSINDTLSVVETELKENMHTPEALAAISDLVAASESGLVDATARGSLLNILARVDSLMGLKLLDSLDITEGQKNAISKRINARENGDFEKADEIRAQLLADNLVIRDTPLGTIWSRNKL